jgi:hypothetical protein
VKNFQESEFRYRPEYASVVLVKKLDKLRSRITDVFRGDVAIIIHVCAGKAGDHANGSYHYPEEHNGVAMAADLHFSYPIDEHNPVLELACIQEVGFGGIGYYPEWRPVPGWHLDVRKNVEWPVYWTRKRGKYHYGLLELSDTIEAEVINDG